ncbi:unnamed protein product [Symbiodinium microadriaticum]|nr:unnamed protein product [Symbiodinium microadriaticum]
MELSLQHTFLHVKEKQSKKERTKSLPPPKSSASWNEAKPSNGLHAYAAYVRRLHEFNPGSGGHPEFCYRPCAYFQSGHCRRLSGCQMCHFYHERVRLDKMQRSWLERLSERELLVTLLVVLEAKSQEGWSSQVFEMEQLVLGRCRVLPADAPTIPPTKQRNLLKALLRMSASQATGCITNCRRFSPVLAGLLEEEVFRQRQHPPFTGAGGFRAG